MYKLERRITEAFLSSGTLEGSSRREYKVGFPLPAPEAKAKNETAYILDASLNVLSRKIDAVVENDKEVWLLESKIRLNPSALGRALTYRELFLKDHPQEGRSVKTGIICLDDDPAVRRIAEAQGIKVFVLPRSKLG